jgi:uncharacterized protein (DUF1330 family)
LPNDADIHDQAGMDEYLEKVPATLRQYGATLRAATSNVETVEGGWTSRRIVILEFADMDAARTWYNSPEYQAVLPLRLNAANDRVVFVEGM